MYKPEEVFDVKFVSSRQTTEVVQPCKQSLNSPVMPIPAQFSVILSSVPDAITLMWCNHVDALRLKLGIQPIAVVSAVADQSLGFGSDKALLKGSFDKSLRGLPRPSVLRCGFISSNRSMTFHYISFNSSRRGIGLPQHELR